MGVDERSGRGLASHQQAKIERILGKAPGGERRPAIALVSCRKETTWKTLADVRMDFRHADPVGACTVFNIKGNHYRLIAGVRYEMQRVFVLKVMTHKQYDTEDWKNECHCY